MVSIVKTVAPVGFEGSIVEVECDSSKSLPSLQIVGLGNKAIDEARERVRSAITNSLFRVPQKENYNKFGTGRTTKRRRSL